MDFTECISTRRSVRRFTDEPITRDLMEIIVTEATFAPSWKNGQPTRYIAVEDKTLKKQLADNCVMGHASNRAVIEGAPLIVILTYLTNRSGFERDGSFSTSKETHWESFDTGIAAQTFCLAAWNKGLGSVIMGIFDEEKVIETAKLPEGHKVAALIAIGYPSETPNAPKRKEAKDILLFV